MATALVTGASAGIGKSFCMELASRGHDLVIVARNEQRLTELKAELEAAHPISVEVLRADLSDRLEVHEVATRLADPTRPVDLLVNNAGFGMKKSFLDNDLHDEEQSLSLLVRAVMVLSHAAGQAMRARRQGAIINVSSVASFMASGTYSAAKAFVTVFSEGLANELRPYGVTVTALCPGYTRTEFHQRGDLMGNPFGDYMWLDADKVVRDCLADVDRGKVISVPGAQYKALTTVMRAMPRPLVRSQRLGNQHRPKD